MDHPLIHEDNSSLRGRVVQLLRSAYSVRRQGNIVFVCGGNDPADMRSRFLEYCGLHHPEFEIFFPEFAMKHYFANGDGAQFDIADFESLVGDLSHAIVLFPEAPGSFAETGYFSVIQELASKTILAMNAEWQGKDSFISMGPAKKISESSRYYGVIQTPYANPTFEDIVQRINRYALARTMKSLIISEFSALSNYEKFCLIHQCFSLLKIATIDDVIFILRAVFSSRLSIANIKQLASVLVGAQYLKETGAYGHHYVNTDKGHLLKIRTGFANEESSIALELAEIFGSGEPEFLNILEAAGDAA